MIDNINFISQGKYRAFKALCIFFNPWDECLCNDCLVLIISDGGIA